MKRRSWIAISSILALVAGVLAISPALKARGDARVNAEQALLLMSEAKTQALALRDDANRLMVTYTQKNASLDEDQIASIRRHIDDMNGLTAKLDNAAEWAEPGQRDVLARINPLLKELASNMNSVVGYLDNREAWNHESEFMEYIAENYNVSRETAALIASAVDYGVAREKFEDSYGRFLNALMSNLG
jgi:hypothetical protein